ncbi:MAG TPA: TraR/DksA C4-type zinc finger protein [Gemmatimonadota bacterium]|nr:TraR/DksA C4-type zinc finger protein [Gemmatimonadota bacterium]
MATKKSSGGKASKKAGKKKAGKKKAARSPRKKRPATRKASKKAARKKAPVKRAARKPGKAARKKAARKAARKKTATPRRPSSARAPKKGVRGARRDKAFFDHFRGRLLEERDRIVRRLEGLRAELSGLQEMPRELEEWAQEEKDRDILIRLEERESAEMRRIQAALERIDDGSYGLCQICGRSIPRDRLEELPTAFRCIEHSG